MIHFTADLHINHKNVIQYQNRPFTSVQDMNDTIITYWNLKVDPDDIVYILGDFAFSDSRDILPRLNGKKILLQGDHDKDAVNQARGSFLDIAPLINLSAKEGLPHVRDLLRQYDLSITLCHWCMRTWRKSHFNSWHLYGHSHGRLEPIGKSWDVGVDNNNFSPLSLLDVIEIMKTRPDNPNLVNRG
jgi:calcineurin-like phosphoesterase family protein